MHTNEEGSDDEEFLGEYIYESPPTKRPNKTELEIRKERAHEPLKAQAERNIWDNSCNEIREEMKELNAILMQICLPPHDYNKDKSFPVNEYTEAPNIDKCMGKDYLDFYVFPYLLPAIEALILFAKKNRIFQCRHSTFNAADFISEFLYNINPRHPSRQTNPVPLLETPFAVKWLLHNPRPPMPKWLTMPEAEAAELIQKNFRGYLVRKREDVQEMRQFWRDLKQDKEEEACPAQVNYNSEITDEEIDRDLQPLPESKPPTRTHSEDCELCSQFNKLLQLEKNPNDEDNPFRLDQFTKKYNFCCFNPNGHLLHTKTVTSKDKLKTAYPTLSCVRKIRSFETKIPTKRQLGNEAEQSRRKSTTSQHPPLVRIPSTRSIPETT